MGAASSVSKNISSGYFLANFRCGEDLARIGEEGRFSLAKKC
jgi:hypothetical protein